MSFQGLRQMLWRTSAVANLIEVSDQAQLTAELLQICQLQNSGAILKPGKGGSQRHHDQQ